MGCIVHGDNMGHDNNSIKTRIYEYQSEIYDKSHVETIVNLYCILYF